MIRAILWKEFREQFAILATLLVMGGGLVVGVAMLDAPSDGNRGPWEFRELSEPARAMLVAIVSVSGLVVGATLFAGEEELKTAPYLYGLPLRRSRLFRAKVTAGFVLAAGLVFGLLAVGWGAGLYGAKHTAIWLAAIGFLGLTAFTAGVAGSTAARSTLVGCALGIEFSQFWGVVGLIPSLIARYVAEVVFDVDGQNPDTAVLPFLIVPVFVAPACLVQGFLQFTASDRRRNASRFGPGPVAEVRKAVRSAPIPHVRFGFRRLFWLTRRQLGMPALILSGVALAVGLSLLHPEMMPAVVWPVATLAFSALMGTLAFADEQITGANRFWAERQLPAGRFWVAKGLGAFAVCLGLAILLLLPRYIAAMVGDEEVRREHLFRSGLLPTLRWSAVYFLALGPMYGLTFGLLCGMLFKKPVVAAATAMLLAATTAVLWVPSLFTGGLHFLQVALPPLVVLVTARRMTRFWVNETVGTRRGVIRLASGSVVAFLLLALGIGYRVAEIREAPEGEDDLAFAKTIPTYDDKQPGRDLRAAAARYTDNLRAIQPEGTDRIFGKRDPNLPVGPDGRPWQKYLDQIRVANERGWPEDRPDLDRWMDRLCAGDWIDKAKALRGRPAGVFEDPNDMTFGTVSTYAYESESLAEALIARGLQLQVRGDDGAFVAQADAALAAVRTGRNKTTVQAAFRSRRWTWPVMAGTDAWLTRLDGRADLLRELLAAFREHETAPPANPTELLLAEQIVVRNSYKAPQQWAPQLFAYRGNTRTAKAEADWLAFAWNVPWEKERLRRLIGRMNATEPNVTPIQQAKHTVRSWLGSAGPTAGTFEADRGLSDGLPGDEFGELLAYQRLRGVLTGPDMALSAKFRMGILKVALRLYQAEKGRLPETLDALVPDYLPEVPADPFDSKPLRYRVSAGEVLYGKPIEPPARELTIPLDDDQYIALSAVVGGVVRWPTAWNDSFPGAEPGGPGVPLAQTDWWGPIEWSAAQAVVGGVAAAPAEFPTQLPPPGTGLGGPDGLSDEEWDAVAAVAGAAVQWPLAPLHPTAPPGVRMRIPPHVRWSREEVIVLPGQAVLWSVGPDRTDGHGVIQSAERGDKGDLIELVPLPPKPRGKEVRR